MKFRWDENPLWVSVPLNGGRNNREGEQGAADEQEFTLLREYLDTQVFYGLMHGRASFSDAAMIYFRCRRMGITVRSAIDLLIVQIALENELFLLHDDRDFTAIKKAVPGLKVYLSS